eukprot:1688556-Rhodomonas_salina.2
MDSERTKDKQCASDMEWIEGLEGRLERALAWGKKRQVAAPASRCAHTPALPYSHSLAGSLALSLVDSLTHSLTC